MMILAHTLFFIGMLQRKYSFIILCLFYFIVSPVHAQPSIEKPNWDQWLFLLGEWIGEGEGDPGKGSGSFTFRYDLQERILIRKNVAHYPATKDHPEFTHDDLMIIHQNANQQWQATYWDNEGHVINYIIEFSTDPETITFLSEANPSTPRYKLSYHKIDGNTVSIKFDIAPPGKPDSFSNYIEAKAHKK